MDFTCSDCSNLFSCNAQEKHRPRSFLLYKIKMQRGPYLSNQDVFRSQFTPSGAFSVRTHFCMCQTAPTACAEPGTALLIKPSAARLQPLSDIPQGLSEEPHPQNADPRPPAIPANVTEAGYTNYIRSRVCFTAANTRGNPHFYENEKK